MNVTTKEFWKKADDYDRVNKKYRYPIFHNASVDLPRNPQYGPGSKGGGRVVLCDYCASAKYVNNNRQNFCSRTCYSEYVNADVVPKVSGKYKRRHTVTKVCSFCDKKYKIETFYLNRGHGIYCSNKCALHARGFKSIWFHCNTCGSKFKAITDYNALYCCEDCRSADTHYEGDVDEIYVKRVPKFVNNEDKLEQIINMQLETIMKHAKKRMDLYEITISPQVRMMVVEKKHLEDIPDYYMTDTARKYRKLFGMDSK